MLPSLDAIFKPRSVAVIGASRAQQTISYQLLDMILAGAFTGPVYPVNPKSRVIHSIRAYPSVLDIPGGLDLGFVVVPKEHVLGVARECGDRGVKGLVVISAGFRETGDDGAALEDELLAVVRDAGMRMVGPNCMGVINTDPEVRLVGTFAPIKPLTGKVGFVSQSGAMGYGILDMLKSLGLGISKFASIGNKADVNGVDLLAYLGEDPATEIILMYLESFGDPFRFSSLAKEITQRKPIVVVKSGRTTAGALAASSHTGALASTDVSVDALFEECGVIRTNTIEEMFDIAMAFTSQPVPRGDRIAIVSNAGGPAILATDAAVREGMQLAEFTPATGHRLGAVLPEDSKVQNPLDLIAGATPELYRDVLDAVLSDPGVDSVLAIFAPTILLGEREFADAICQASSLHENKPVTVCAIGRRGLTRGLSKLRQHSIPTYSFPESAIYALAAMGRFRTISLRREGEIVRLDADREGAEAVLAPRRSAGPVWLSDSESRALVEAYGFASPATERVGDENDAVTAAERIGYPVVLKAELEGLSHKSDIGAVRVGLDDETAVRTAWKKMNQRLGEKGVADRVRAYVVQEMIEGGVEVILGVKRDGEFGHLVMFGLGGIAVEVLKDVTFKIAPVTEAEAHDMVKSIRGYPLLQGFRGQQPANIEYIVDSIRRVSQLVGDFKEVSEIDINPLVVYEDENRCRALDVRICIEPIG
jgi:acetyltransferase